MRILIWNVFLSWLNLDRKHTYPNDEEFLFFFLLMVNKFCGMLEGVVE